METNKDKPVLSPEEAGNEYHHKNAFDGWIRKDIVNAFVSGNDFSANHYKPLLESRDKEIAELKETIITRLGNVERLKKESDSAFEEWKVNKLERSINQ